MAIWTNRATRPTICGLQMLALVALYASACSGIEASPTIDSASHPYTTAPAKLQETTGKSEAQPQLATGLRPVSAQGQPGAPSVSVAPLVDQPLAATKSHGQLGGGAKLVRANNAEKLKRGLTNFINHLNPASFFVPAQIAGSKTTTATATGVQAEPATIVNDGPSADVLIKGPNRLVQARPLGGPLRWGRR